VKKVREKKLKTKLIMYKMKNKKNWTTQRKRNLNEKYVLR
jgi:hypothetical protein